MPSLIPRLPSGPSFKSGQASSAQPEANATKGQPHLKPEHCTPASHCPARPFPTSLTGIKQAENSIDSLLYTIYSDSYLKNTIYCRECCSAVVVHPRVG